MKKLLLFLIISTLSFHLIAMEVKDLKLEENEDTHLLLDHTNKQYGTQNVENIPQSSPIIPMTQNILMKEEPQLNKYQKAWPFSLCPQKYDDQTCNDRRDCMATCVTAFGVGSLFSKSLTSAILCCTGGSCKDSCSFVWVGPNNCDTGCNTFGSVWQSMTTGALIASFLIAGCAQLPCYNKKNCRLCCCKEDV